MNTPIYQYKASNDRFQYSSDEGLADSTWVKDGVAFYASNEPGDGLVPVYKYHAGSGNTSRYLYSLNPDTGNGWTQESIAFYVYEDNANGAVPVFAFHKAKNEGWYFRYSVDQAIDDGWAEDGPAFYASTSRAYQVGDKHPDGGIVFQVDETGMHGMMCAPEDLDTKENFENTIAKAKEYKGGGWYAPTKRHLDAMYEELHKQRGIGNFKEDVYRSTEFLSAHYQRALNFGNGQNVSVGLRDETWVRPVKAF
ncbi:hypothetical protein D6779_05740 [Candidatus Parcubacteria bacterium]|nr:MAG: hypothetical protein D6779_05740 [Candidatus Parcubacteria bacterium]